MGLEDTPRIGETVTRLLMFGPVARDNSGKIGNNLGRDETTQYHLEKVLNGLEMVLGAQDKTFPGYFQEKSGSWEMAFGNADSYLSGPIL